MTTSFSGSNNAQVVLSRVLLILLYLCAPPLLLRMHRAWGVPAAILSLWLPIETGAFLRLGIHPFLMMAIAAGTCVLTFHSRKEVLDVRTAFSVFTIEWKRAVMGRGARTNLQSFEGGRLFKGKRKFLEGARREWGRTRATKSV